MSLERNPFEPVKLEEERGEEKGRVFTTRFNEKDLEALEDLKRLWGVESDNGTIRAAVHFARNVTQIQFAGGLSEVLFKKKRMR